MLKHFTDFLHKRFHRDDITFKDVNFKTISDFADYLLTDGGCAHNTAMKMMGYFKTAPLLMYFRESGAGKLY